MIVFLTLSMCSILLLLHLVKPPLVTAILYLGTADCSHQTLDTLALEASSKAPYGLNSISSYPQNVSLPVHEPLNTCISTSAMKRIS